MENGEKRARGGGMAEINVTPLVDVLLVLLVIFMVTAPSVHQGAKVPTPDISTAEANNQSVEEEKDTVFVEKDGRIKFRNRYLTLQQLAEMIRSSPELLKKGELFIRAEPNLNYGRVMEVLGTIRKSGIGKLGFIVYPEDIIPIAQQNKGEKGEHLKKR